MSFKKLTQEIERTIKQTNCFVEETNYLLVCISGSSEKKIKHKDVLKNLKCLQEISSVYFFENNNMHNSLILIPPNIGQLDRDRKSAIYYTAAISFIYSNFYSYLDDCFIIFSDDIQKMEASISVFITKNFIEFLKTLDPKVKSMPTEKELKVLLDKEEPDDVKKYGIFYNKNGKKITYIPSDINKHISSLF